MKHHSLPKKSIKEFKHKQFESELISWSVRWYIRFPISYRDLVIMAEELRMIQKYK